MVLNVLFLLHLDVLSYLPISFSVLRTLVLETDEEVLLIAATVASKIVSKPDQFPEKPLPSVILPPYLSSFILNFNLTSTC